MRLPVRWLAILACVFLWTRLSYGDEYRISPPPDWVSPFPFENPARIPEDAVSDGCYFLLVDTQANPKTGSGEFYKHYAEKVVNQGGIEALSQVLITFDPSYQSLVVHGITVHRDGRAMDRLRSEKASLLQREEGLEERIYDGSLTFNVILDDLRVGDIVEYSFTLRGTNPVFEDRYYNDIGAQWRIPVRRFYHRLLWPTDRPMFIKHHGKEVPVRIREADGLREYLFSDENLPAILPDSDLPDGYSPFPWLQFSETGGWEEIARWGAELYRIPDETSPELDAKIREIMSADPTREGRLIQALRFVQDEVRYMGMEIGPSTHRPHDPSIVLQRRFGDCKDKVFLLHKMLRAMEIESRPALVNTRYRDRIRQWHPSPYAFNHVILEATAGGDSFWLDPTRSYQRGSLQHMTQPDYGVALALDEKTQDLIPMEIPSDPLPNQEIEERFDLKNGLDQPAAYTVTSVYRGTRADALRRQFDKDSAREIEKSYLNFYISLYPDILMEEPISVEDDVETNTVTVTEHYTIPGFWRQSDSTGMVEAGFQPLELYSLILPPTTKRRSMPLGIAHPIHFRQTTQVLLPDEWDITPETTHFEDGAMVFDQEISYRNRRLTIFHAYRSKADHLPAAKAMDHIANLKRIEDELGYLIYTSEKGIAASRREGSSWPVLGMAGLSLAFGVLIAARAYRFHPSHRLGLERK